MPFPPHAPSVYFEETDIEALVTAFSERVRSSAKLRPAMDRLVGNQWAEAEAAMIAFLNATLFLDQTPEVDGDWLARAMAVLDAEAIDQLGDILLDCVLVVLPLHSVAAIAEIGDALSGLLKDVVSHDGAARQRLLLKARSRIVAGALMSGL